MKYKAVFFDLDGTLMDTSEGVFAGGRYAMEKAGLAFPELENPYTFIGPPLGDCFRVVLGVRDEATVEALCHYYHDYYSEKGCYLAKFYPGIPEVLETLKKRGYILGIASMKNEDMVQKMCRHFKVDSYFDQQLGIDLTGTMDKAALLEKGFRSLGLKSSECVLVGDTTVDEAGAVKAGCDIIRANWGFGFTKTDPGTISSPLEILDLV